MSSTLTQVLVLDLILVLLFFGLGGQIEDFPLRYRIRHFAAVAVLIILMLSIVVVTLFALHLIGMQH